MLNRNQISFYIICYLIGLIVISLVVSSCSDTTSYSEKGLDRMGQILALDTQSNQIIMEEINLFDLIPDESRVTLNEEQKRLIAVVKNRPTTAELHFANLINDPQNLLKERSEEHTSELQSRGHLVCRLLIETTI